MSRLMPPEKRKETSAGSPMRISPPVREWTMLSMPSRSAVPGATMSRARSNRGSCRASNSCKSSPGSEDAIANDGSRNQRTVLCGQFRVERSGWPLSSRSGGRVLSARGLSPCGQRRCPRAGPPAPPPARQRCLETGNRSQPMDGLVRRRWTENAVEAELERLRNAPVGVRYVANLAGQADLPEAGEGLAVDLESSTGMGRGDGKGDREVGAGL